MLTNHAHCEQNFDRWPHYRAMLVLVLWNEVSGDTEALCAAEQIADLLCEWALMIGAERLAAQTS